MHIITKFKINKDIWIGDDNWNGNVSNNTKWLYSSLSKRWVIVVHAYILAEELSHQHKHRHSVFLSFQIYCSDYFFQKAWWDST